jgi:microcompartment protein CcmK/EutM
MQIAKVIGTTVSSVKDERLEGSKLMLVCPADEHGEVTGPSYVALDKVGAGQGELVFVVQGSSARFAAGNANTPVDAAIIGIFDSMAVHGETTYHKG